MDPSAPAPAHSHASLARRLQGLNVYLVGMMGAGKSAVGRPLAAALGYRFLDADTALEQAAGRPIPTVFAEDGEGHLHQGVVVWLDAPETLLLARLRADPTPRPLLNDPDPAGRLATLLAARRPLYAQADLQVVQVEAPPEAVALQVLEALPTILREQPSAPRTPAMLLDGEGEITQSLN